MSTQPYFRLPSVVGFVAIAWACAGPALTLVAQERAAAPAGEQAPGDAEGKQERKKRLDEMRRLAENTNVWHLRGAEKMPAKLVGEPVLRFDSQYYGAIDGTMWLYGTKGRPAAVQTVVCWRRPGFPKHEYCLVSLSDGLIEARWPGEREWSSTKPGVEMRELSKGLKPASTETERMRQMKEMVRRFTATRIDVGNIREENRALARQIHRYRDPESGLQDGAIFVFVANGTAPDFYLLLELRGPDLARATWNYGVHRTTTGELHVRLDGNEVWSVPLESNPGRDIYATYLHFFPRQQEPAR